MTIKLSKSKFVAGCECPKRLYSQVQEPDAAAEAIIEQGLRLTTICVAGHGKR